MAKKKAKTFEVEGTFRYYKGFPQNKDTRGPEGADWQSHGGMYITDFIMDEDNLGIFEETGSQWKVYGQTKKDREKHNLEDGEFMIRPRRKHEAQFPQYGGPPVTVLADGSALDPEKGMGVGNGSKGFLQFTVYETPLHPGSRWEGAQIIDWLQYPLPTESSGGATFESRGSTNVTEYVPEGEEAEAPKASKAKSKEKLDDLEDTDIPL